MKDLFLSFFGWGKNPPRVDNANQDYWMPICPYTITEEEILHLEHQLKLWKGGGKSIFMAILFLP